MAGLVGDRCADLGATRARMEILLRNLSRVVLVTVPVNRIWRPDVGPVYDTTAIRVFRKLLGL